MAFAFSTMSHLLNRWCDESSSIMVTRNSLLAGACFLFVACIAHGASESGGPLVQPLEGWLIGVLVVILISILSRHKPARFGRDRTKPAARGKS
jgi:hypothetical protein